MLVAADSQGKGVERENGGIDTGWNGDATVGETEEEARGFLNEETGKTHLWTSTEVEYLAANSYGGGDALEVDDIEAMDESVSGVHNDEPLRVHHSDTTIL